MRRTITPMVILAALCVTSLAWTQEPMPKAKKANPAPMNEKVSPAPKAEQTAPTPYVVEGSGPKEPCNAHGTPPLIAQPGIYNSSCNGDCGGCNSGCCKEPCEVEWFQKWSCDDLKMERVECDPCANRSFFWCPKVDEEEECDACAEGNGEAEGTWTYNEKESKWVFKPAEKKEEKTESKSEGVWTYTDKGWVYKEAESKDDDASGCDACEEEEEEEEDEGPSTPLMQLFACLGPHHCGKKEHGLNVYGWVQAGFTANFDSPRDRLNVGTGYNFRSNDFLLNQAWLVFENELEHDDEFNIGYRVDAMIGTDAQFNVQQGLFDDIIGSGTVGNQIGFDLPQFFVEAHIPNFLGTNGLDLKFGKWFTLVNYEVIPGPGNFFYSRTYNFFAGPFNNTGGLGTVHLTDTLDFTAGIFVGWEKFEDNNSAPSYTAALSWTSCDERLSWVTAMQTGPEQDNNNDNFRTQVSSYVTSIFGSYDEWTAIFGGSYAYDSNAVGAGQDARWYATTGYLLYKISPKLQLGVRGEYFRDEQGFRTPPGTFYETTFGFNYFPYKNLRLRPELRFDWATQGTPFNDMTDSMQTTAAIDVIWEF